MEQGKEGRGSTACTSKILECAFRVSNTLGCGFLEKVYENALVVELRENGLGVLQQPKVEVLYKGRLVGEYVADMIVDRSVVVEVKALASLERIHEAQVMNYLRGTNLTVGLLLNFGRPRVEYRRIAWSFVE